MKLSKPVILEIARLVSVVHFSGNSHDNREMAQAVAEDIAAELLKDNPRMPWDKFMAIAQGDSK